MVSCFQQSKNTVSFPPCKHTFHSRVVCSCLVGRAIRVSRRDSGTICKTGSEAFSGSSGKYIRVTSFPKRPRLKKEICRSGALGFPSAPRAGAGSSGGEQELSLG